MIQLINEANHNHCHWRAAIQRRRVRGAATIIVTNTNDSGPGSLRQALAVAQDGDSITFAVSGTITLTSGGLGVVKNVTISGPGADQLSIVGIPIPICFLCRSQSCDDLWPEHQERCGWD